jgi:hypothetical protein
VIEVSRENGSREPWELEMDRRELAGIGITAESFQSGDAVLVRAGRIHAPRGQRDSKVPRYSGLLLTALTSAGHY